MQRTWKKLVGVAFVIVVVMGLVAPMVAATTSTYLDSSTGEPTYIADPDDTVDPDPGPGTGGPFPDPPYPDPMPPPPAT